MDSESSAGTAALQPLHSTCRPPPSPTTTHPGRTTPRKQSHAATPTVGPFTSMQLPVGPPQLEGAGPSSLAEWLATRPSPDTLPRRFAVLLQCDPPAYDGRTYHSIPRTPQRLEGCDEGIERDVYRESSPLSTSSGVLHLVGQQGAPSTSTQTQDFDEEMDDPPQSWTPDEDDKWGMGPPM
ncbi:hypothetical protein DFH08DRAFT_819567 [Mycena albidolilacea]|uniref:Uncharacterized protein n=1 Tax=Mycena albidolilacea TaxID=1033008 RepID=A0AAD7EF95_9AGAR|nr:hypothetical protein DFH08DRAFT_819567 [Mycena albidolilacea]